MNNIETKKSTYNAKAQKKYDEKRKKLALTVFNDKYDIIVEKMNKKGFTSVNSYLKSLVEKDLNIKL